MSGSMLHRELQDWHVKEKRVYWSYCANNKKKAFASVM